MPKQTNGGPNPSKGSQVRRKSGSSPSRSGSRKKRS